MKYLRRAGIKVPNKSNEELASIIRKATGWQMRGRAAKTVIKYFVKVVMIEGEEIIKNTDIDSMPPPPKKKKEKTFAQSKDFLSSYEWRQIRYQALTLNDGKCELCGRNKHDGITLNVDHIKPRKTHPQLALDIDNLQVLCNECNHGKGNSDDTNWREK
jgi:hypothetical protein